MTLSLTARLSLRCIFYGRNECAYTLIIPRMSAKRDKCLYLFLPIPHDRKSIGLLLLFPSLLAQQRRGLLQPCTFIIGRLPEIYALYSCRFFPMTDSVNIHPFRHAAPEGFLPRTKGTGGSPSSSMFITKNFGDGGAVFSTTRAANHARSISVISAAVTE